MAKVHQHVEATLKLVSLETKTDRLVGELAHGDQRATEIMMALALKPRLLLLDEPTAGMGDQETYEITQLIRRLHRDSKLTIVLIEHDMRVVFHLADLITVLDQGSFLAEGTPREIAGERGRADCLSGPGSMSAALTAEGLHTYYGKSHILYGVSLEAAEGQVTALLGRNGAGKTTTLRSVMGLTAAREGRVTIFGRETTRWPPFRVAALGVGYVPEGRKIFPNLTVRENLMVPLERPGPWTPQSVYRLFPRLAERRLSRGRQLSGGEQEMLSIARALLVNPEAPHSRRTLAGTCAAYHARSLPHCGADARGGDRRPAGGAERAHEPGDRGSRLCARQRSSRLFRFGRRACRRRRACPIPGRCQRRGVDAHMSSDFLTQYPDTLLSDSKSPHGNEKRPNGFSRIERNQTRL